MAIMNVVRLCGTRGSGAGGLGSRESGASRVDEFVRLAWQACRPPITGAGASTGIATCVDQPQAQPQHVQPRDATPLGGPPLAARERLANDCKNTMKMKAIAVVLAGAQLAAAAHYAVLVAGSSTFANYRHQADGEF